MPQTRLENCLLQNPNGFYLQLTGGKQMHVQPKLSVDGRLIGVDCSSLGSSPFLQLAVFEEVINHLARQANRRARKGDAHGSKLGTPGLPFDSVEGHVAHFCYGKQAGDSVFRRITPISRILAWSGVCVNGRGYLELIP